MRRRLPRAPGRARRIGGDLRADRRSRAVEGPGRTQGRAHRHAGHGHRRSPAAGTPRHAAARRCARDKRRLRPGLGGSVERPLPGQRSRRRRRCSTPNSRAWSRPKCWSPTKTAGRRRVLGARRPATPRAVVCSMPTAGRRQLLQFFGLHDLAGFGIEDRAARDRRRRRAARLRRGNAEAATAAPDVDRAAKPATARSR